MKAGMLTTVAAAMVLGMAQAGSLTEELTNKLQGRLGSPTCEYYCPDYSEAKRWCARNILDCDCDDGYNKDLANDACVLGEPEKGSCNYLCPVGSHRTTEFCAKDFDDCKCKKGYVRKYDQCVCVADYQCPTYSHRKEGRDCYRNMNDCECDPGYWLQYGKCEKKPECNYICPKGSHRTVPGCPKDFYDCECKAGYERKGHECVPVPTCDYECPEYASTKYGVDCPKSFNDCQCNYICPTGSHRTVAGCPKDFYDCKCKDGYERNGHECVPVPTCNYKCPDYSSPKYGVDCPKTFLDCKCDYFCPSGSHRTVAGCAKDFYDCGCKDGYEKTQHGCECTANYECPRYSYRKPNRSCYNNFDDCECQDGYEKSYGKCIPSHKY